MPPNSHESLRPGWSESAPWMGCSLGALLGILAANRMRVDVAYWPECFFDLCFAAANSAFGAIEKVWLGRKVAATALGEDPIFIIGHWRTGTTLLHELLALDNRLRCPTTYECFAPNHFLLSGDWLKRWTSFTLPQSRPPDKMRVTWDSPQEDEMALCLLGVPSPYATIAFPNHPPQNQRYLELDSLSLREQRRWEGIFLAFLKRLICGRAGRLVLKSPTHTFRLPTLTRMFPKARWVNLVRNPYHVFSSTVRLWRTMCAAYGYQKPKFEGLEEYVLAMFIRMHERLEETRHLLPPGTLIDVPYEELLRYPRDTMRRIYESLGLEGFEAVGPAIDRYFAERADYRPNRHELAPRWRDEVRRLWEPYFQRYGYSIDGGDVVSDQSQ